MALIKCSECGNEVSDKATSCPKCGCPIVAFNKVTEIGNRKQEPIPKISNVPNTSQYANPKFHAKKPNYSWILWIILFPLAPFYLIWKSKKLSQNTKIIFTLVVCLLFVIVSIVQNTGELALDNKVDSISISVSKDKIYEDNTIDISIVVTPALEDYSLVKCESSNQKVRITDKYQLIGLSEGETVISCKIGSKESNSITITVKKGIKGLDFFTNAGLTEKFVDNFLSLYEYKDWGEIWSVKAPIIEKDFTVTPVTTYEVDLKVYSKNDEIIKVVDFKGVTVYKDGVYNQNYLYIRDVSNKFGTYRDKTMDIIKANLKAPSTAKFPGSLWNGYENWTYAIRDNYLTISSYVDAQNSFGAAIRTEFIVQYTFESGVYSATYIALGSNESGTFK